ncbi:MAG TPA: transglutaminase family protein [Candidatus Acidoferrales bacterium]|nr:transglutaminase family protein [Candidatus Acidoferrales bacterium]
MPTPAVVMVQPKLEGSLAIVEEHWDVQPAAPFREGIDALGNGVRRIVLPEGDFLFRYDAIVTTSSDIDPTEPSAQQIDPHELSDETLIYLLPSRYCPSDALIDTAWELFGNVDPGWPRVQAVSDWVHENIRFEYGGSSTTTSATETLERRVGVCRDFSHLAVAFCRALNVPARYAFGYLPDIGVTPPDAPMDFCAWMEVYLSGRWWTFDPRNNERRIAHIVIGRGRDAADVPMIMTFGNATLAKMTVWADQI